MAQFEATKPLPTDPNVKIGKLANGLTYYIHKNALPVKKIQLRLVVNVGSVLETSDQQGFAHFMEHMNFNGLKHFPKNDLVSYLQSIGVQFGADLNAVTGFDEKDIAKVKETLIKQYEVQIKNNDLWLEGLSRFFIDQTDPAWILAYPGKVEGVTAAQLQQLCKKLMDTPNYIKAVLYPEK